MKNAPVAVIGMGYVGIPAAVMLADAGFDVTGIQRRSARSGWKIDCLNQGKCPIGGNEPELPEMIKRVVDAGRFRVTDDYAALKHSRIILLDIQTPTNADHVPEYESLSEACRQVGRYLSPGKLVIIESTVAPGTTRNLVEPILLRESKLQAGLPEGFGLCFSYERVMVGRLIHNIREYPKIVGGIDEESARIAAEMYGAIVRGGVHCTDIITAEISKTVENAYRDVQIGFANEVALLCESLGADVNEVRKFVNGLPNDPSAPHANPVRNMHFPGAGVGGHCLPKDSWLLLYGSDTYAPIQQSCPVSVLKDARNINDWMPVHMAGLVEDALKEIGKPLKGAQVGVLGYAFLENSDDARNTPTLCLVEELERRGAACRIHDPYVKRDGVRPIEGDLQAVLRGCDAVVLMTKHDDYAAITPDSLASLVGAKVLVDGRGLFDAKKFLAAGFTYRGIGRGDVNHST